MKFRTLYNYDRDQVSVESGLDCSMDAGVTQQQFRDECDINVIVKRFGLTGQLPQNVRMPMYGDFTEIGDFRSAVLAIQSAKESFMQLPADVRSRFENDPARFVDFCSDPANLESARGLGLVPAKELKTPDVSLQRRSSDAAAAPVSTTAAPSK